MNTRKKRLRMILSLVLVLAVLMPGLAQGVVFEDASSGFNGTITKSTYVFAAKSTKSSYRLASLAKGDVVPVSHWDGDYAVVTLSDGVGYVPSNLVNVTFGRSQIGTTNGAANIYKSASSKNRSFHYDSAGNRVKVTGRIGSFYKVDVYGDTYYMRVKDLSLTGLASGSVRSGSTSSGTTGSGFVRDDAESTKRDNSSATVFVASYGGWGYDPNNYGYPYYGWNSNFGYPYGWNNAFYGRGYGYSTGTLSFRVVEDGTNIPIAGAEFSLVYNDSYGYGWGSRSFTATSGADGYVTFSNLYPGSYLLKQTSAPLGYDRNTGSWGVTVDQWGGITAGGHSGGGFSVTNQTTP